MKKSASNIMSLLLTLFYRAAWLPMLVLLTHFILYNALDLYAANPIVNVFVHFTGGIAIAYFLHHALRLFLAAGYLGKPDTLLCFILLFSLVATAAIFWEFGEFVSDHTLGTHAQLSLKDTLFDMAAGIAGGFGYLLCAFAPLGYRNK